MPSLQSYIDDSKRYRRDEFLRFYMCPVLLLQEGAAQDSDFSTVTSMMVRLPKGTTPMQAVRQQLVLPLQKRSGAPFASQISVGRGRGVDVGLENDSVSKFHAYFMVEADRSSIADAGSLNGTTLNGVPLTPRTLTPLDNAAQLTFGEMRTQFYTASGFWDFLQQTHW